MQLSSHLAQRPAGFNRANALRVNLMLTLSYQANGLCQVSINLELHSIKGWYSTEYDRVSICLI